MSARGAGWLGLWRVCLYRGRHAGRRGIARTGVWAALGSIVALTAAVGILAWALLSKDFRFDYVAQYTDALLPWNYALSAFWVGQAGSLLLWAWLVGIVAAAYRLSDRSESSTIREIAFGTQMVFLCFLVTILVFAADPMQPSLVARSGGDGLAPELQHMAMMLHPPIIFLGYAAWGVPFSLALAALVAGRLDADWVRSARPWALFAWAALGAGILWGADWAYEELGWGGYWSWDPVENGSLIPWLAGTALLHGLSTWRRPGIFKKSTLCLAFATFALCNFAAFLTRSGIFSSLHAFSRSPLGWLFLAWIGLAGAAGTGLILWRRTALMRIGRSKACGAAKPACFSVWRPSSC